MRPITLYKVNILNTTQYYIIAIHMLANSILQSIMCRIQQSDNPLIAYSWINFFKNPVFCHACRSGNVQEPVRHPVIPCQANYLTTRLANTGFLSDNRRSWSRFDQPCVTLLFTCFQRRLSTSSIFQDFCPLIGWRWLVWVGSGCDWCG